MLRRKLKKSQIEDDSSLGWNAFIDLIAMEDYEDLAESQQAAHLIFWYDSEVTNGGHLQYFLNPAGERANETLEALSRLDMDCQYAVLSDAINFLSKEGLRDIISAEDYITEALENRFGEFDERYHNCPAETMVLLENYLKQHFDEFIELI